MEIKYNTKLAEVLLNRPRLTRALTAVMTTVVGICLVGIGEGIGKHEAYVECTEMVNEMANEIKNMKKED